MATSGCGASADPQDGLAAPPPPPPLPASHCARCGNPAVLAARGTTHCRDCFLTSFTNRFTKHIQPARTAAAQGVLAYQTAALSPSSALSTPARPTPAASKNKKKPTLVVACSGGPASTALVHLVHQILFAPPSNHARGNRYSHFLPFDACEVVFVDQSAVPGHGGEDRTDQVRELVASIAPEFTFTVLRLEDVFRPPHSNSVCGVSTSVPELPYTSVSPLDDSGDGTTLTPRERLVALLSPSSSSSFSPTSRASLQRSLLNTLLISHVATQSGSEILLLGETGTRSAIRTLAGMSEGRGYSIGEEVALEQIVRVSPSSSSFSGSDEKMDGKEEEDKDKDKDKDKDREGDKVVMVLRPLGQTVDKEIAFYNREFVHARRVAAGHLGGGASAGGRSDGAAAADVAVVGPEVSAKTRSIPSLVEDFIRTLDADFPSTVPTVVRTAHKLGLRSSHAAFQELASSSSSSPASSSSTSTSSSSATRPTETETNCPLCGVPAQPCADEWRKAITISDLQAVLAADPRAAATTTTTTLGRGGKGKGTGEGGEGTKLVKRREPYQPSQAHLLVKPGDGDEAATTTTAAAAAAATDDQPSSRLAAAATTTTTAKEEVQHENTVAVPSSSLPSTPAPDAAAVEETDSLARYLCYGCLLVLSEPASASAQRANKNKVPHRPAGSPSPSTPHVDLFLPGYVGEAIQRRRDREEEKKRLGVVGTREVRGEEGMRKEVERYLLD